MSDPSTTPPPADPKTTATASKEKPVTIEEAAKQLKAPTWAAAALKARHKWPIGKKMLLGEYAGKLKALMQGGTEADEGGEE